MSSLKAHGTILAALLLATVPSTLRADEAAARQVVWDKTPISVPLSVGLERRVQFAAAVSVGMPHHLQDRLRVQTLAGTVYFLAHRAFAETRIVVRELDSPQTYLLDVHAAVGGNDTAPIEVRRDDAGAAPFHRVDAVTAMPPDYVALTRFAAQQLYAPARLLRTLPGVRQLPVARAAVPLVPDAAIEATPLMAWRAGELYVTAVRLRNRSKRAQTLDPRTLRGAWLSATFQHARLLPAGSDADTTAMYLVSVQAFEASF